MEKRKTAPAKKFVNALEVGFPKELIDAAGACLDKFGAANGYRFVTFSANLDAPANKSESRLSTKVLAECRRAAKTLAQRLIYFPRISKPSLDIIDEEGVRWMRSKGIATRTMMDIYGVNTPTLYQHIGDVKAPTARKRVAQIRNAEAHPEELALGLSWLGGIEGATTDAQKAKVVEKYGPPRIARAGSALGMFRAKFGRDPLRSA